jgi:hypothetical protein
MSKIDKGFSLFGKPYTMFQDFMRKQLGQLEPKFKTQPKLLIEKLQAEALKRSNELLLFLKEKLGITPKYSNEPKS